MLATDGTNLYVVDRDNYAVRLVNPSTGVVTTFAGPLTNMAPALANGTGTAARFNAPVYKDFNGTDFYLPMKTIALLEKLQPAPLLPLMPVVEVRVLPGGNINSTLLSSSFSDNIVSLTFIRILFF